jgi:hypothetical protein
LARGVFIAAAQGLLRFCLFCLRQATMRVMFGISDLQSRNASGVQAARCAAVPMAKLEVEKVASASARTTKLEVSLQIRFMTFPCVPATMQARSHSS